MVYDRRHLGDHPGLSTPPAPLCIPPAGWWCHLQRRSGCSVTTMPGSNSSTEGIDEETRHSSAHCRRGEDGGALIEEPRRSAGRYLAASASVEISTIRRCGPSSGFQCASATRCSAMRLTERQMASRSAMTTRCWCRRWRRGQDTVDNAPSLRGTDPKWIRTAHRNADAGQCGPGHGVSAHRRGSVDVDGWPPSEWRCRSATGVDDAGVWPRWPVSRQSKQMTVCRQ